ncbi:MAG: hypothetical protein WBQ17_16085 [Rhizomicrobium sp.]
MKLLLILILSAATAASLGAERTSREFWDRKFVDVTDGIPPAHVERWLKIRWIGPIAHPIVPAYFIDQNRKPPSWAATRYVVMRPSEYFALIQFTHSFGCSPKRSLKYSEMEVNEFSVDGARNVCTFSSDSGCRYLFGLASIKGIDWARGDTRPLAEFEYELGCHGSSTPSHDAAGRSD